MDTEDAIFTEALSNLRKHAKGLHLRWNELPPDPNSVKVLRSDLRLLIERYDMLSACEFGPGKLLIKCPTAAHSSEVVVSMPLHIAPEMIEAVKRDPSTSIEDKDEWHLRLGWLVCAYDVIVEARRNMRSAA